MTQWMSQPWMLGVAGFFAGIVLTVISSRSSAERRDEIGARNAKEINNLTAENKVLLHKNAALSEKLGELEDLVRQREQALSDLESALEARTDQFENTRTDLKEAVGKIRDLRKELVERAEDTIRAEVHARDVSNELDLLQNTSDMLDAEILSERKPSRA